MYLHSTLTPRHATRQMGSPITKWHLVLRRWLAVAAPSSWTRQASRTQAMGPRCRKSKRRGRCSEREGSPSCKCVYSVTFPKDSKYSTPVRKQLIVQVLQVGMCVRYCGPRPLAKSGNYEFRILTDAGRTSILVLFHRVCYAVYLEKEKEKI